MKKWLKQLTVRLRGSQSGLVLLNLRSRHQTGKDSIAFIGKVSEADKGKNFINLDRGMAELEKKGAAVERQKRAKAGVAVEGGTCPACGGGLVRKVLNYWCDPTTDVFTPADIIETCTSCQRVVKAELPRGGY